MPRHASRVFYSIWPRHPIESSICFWEPRHREPHRGLGISTRSLLRRAFLKVFAQVVSGTADRRDPSYGCQEQHALRTLLPMSGFESGWCIARGDTTRLRFGHAVFVICYRTPSVMHGGAFGGPCLEMQETGGRVALLPELRRSASRSRGWPR